MSQRKTAASRTAKGKGKDKGPALKDGQPLTADQVTAFQKKAQNAADGGYFIKANDTFSGKLTLSGAPNRWAGKGKKGAYPDDVYTLGYRLVGTPDEVAVALDRLGLDQNTINKELAGAVTFDNYDNTMESVFDKEVEDYNSSVKPSPSRMLVNLNDLGDILPLLKKDNIVKKVKEGSSAAPVSRKQTVEARLASAYKDNAFLDVNNYPTRMNRVSGDKVPKNRVTVRGANPPFAAASSTAKTFYKLIDSLDPSYEKYRAQFDTKAKQMAKKSPAKKSPAKKSPAKKSPAKKSPAKKSPAKKPAGKKAAAKKGAAKTVSRKK